eukprot:2979410-Alexandrium_andersonii.AAC.1
MCIRDSAPPDHPKKCLRRALEALFGGIRGTVAPSGRSRGSGGAAALREGQDRKMPSGGPLGMGCFLRRTKQPSSTSP